MDQSCSAGSRSLVLPVSLSLSLDAPFCLPSYRSSGWQFFPTRIEGGSSAPAGEGGEGGREDGCASHQLPSDTGKDSWIDSLSLSIPRCATSALLSLRLSIFRSRSRVSLAGTCTHAQAVTSLPPRFKACATIPLLHSPSRSRVIAQTHDDNSQSCQRGMETGRQGQRETRGEAVVLFLFTI